MKKARGCILSRSRCSRMVWRAAEAGSKSYSSAMEKRRATGAERQSRRGLRRQERTVLNHSSRRFIGLVCAVSRRRNRVSGVERAQRSRSQRASGRRDHSEITFRVAVTARQCEKREEQVAAARRRPAAREG